jgi:hypothetical protein
MAASTTARVARTPEWLARAAVLSVFDIGWIAQVDELGDAGTAEFSEFLAASCERVVDESGVPHWQLRDDERARALRSTPREALRAALDDVTQRPDDPVQRALERYVYGMAAALDVLDAAGLSAELQLDRWVGEIGRAGGESAADIRARLDWLAVTESLRRLIGRGFYGRRELLAECRAFIQGPPLPDYRSARLFGEPVAPCFLIEGVGGSGKSSVLALLILSLPGPDDLAAYLSFDRGWLIDGGQWAIYDEVMRQVGAQLPGHDRTTVTHLREAARREGGIARGIADHASRSSQAIEQVSDKLLIPLSSMLNGNRLVVVLDTLEELARRDDTVSFQVFDFLGRLCEFVPEVRVVGAGRTLPRSFRYPTVWYPTVPELMTVRRLTGLDHDDSLRMMRDSTVGIRITDGALRQVIDLVGGNPLSLRLAADVLNRTGEDPAQVIAVTEGNVQGQLYSRLLEHIKDPRVRAVAHPGLVVRRITAEIIRDVLADPCGIAPLAAVEASEIFRGLRREATLCDDSPDGDAALVHRQDVRAIMLPAIRRDRPATTRAIHEAAVSYYTSHPKGEVSRREELYHRLMLEQPVDVLDERWTPAAGEELVAVLDEFPARGQLYLTTKVHGLRLDPAIRVTASDDEWRQVVRPSVLSYMDVGLLDQALALVQERRDADGHALLPDIEVEALERLGRVEEALSLAETERARAARRGDADLVRALITAQSRIYERLRRWAEAWELWQRLAVLDHARRERTDALDEEVRVRELIVLTSLLRVARNQRRSGPEIEDLVADTVRLAERTPDRILTSTPSLLRDLAGEIGRVSPKILALAERTIGGKRTVSTDDPAWHSDDDPQHSPGTAEFQPAQDYGHPEDYYGAPEYTAAAEDAQEYLTDEGNAEDTGPEWS